MSKKKLTYIGRDDWSRPLYRDENGRIWVDVDPSEQSCPLSLYHHRRRRALRPHAA